MIRSITANAAVLGDLIKQFPTAFLNGLTSQFPYCFVVHNHREHSCDLGEKRILRL